MNESPRLNGNKIILEMKSGFYNGHITTSVIEFICSNQTKVSFIRTRMHLISFKYLNISLISETSTQKLQFLTF